VHITYVVFPSHLKKLAEAGRVNYKTFVGMSDSKPGEVGYRHPSGAPFWEVVGDEKTVLNR
jgi:hypothetical protein